MAVSFISEHVDPTRSPWHLLGAELRYQREQVRWLSLREVARQVGGA